MIKYIIGIDEAGRGPIAGPVALGVCAIPKRTRKGAKRRALDFFQLKAVRDSKKLRPEERERIFALMHAEQSAGRLSFSVSFASSRVIDRKGISFAIRQALRRSLCSLGIAASECLVLLDGSLKAPEEFVFQETIIKGDEKEAVIALASIVAKVSRDRHMVRLARKYPAYAFETHKGYGTAGHYRKIREHGLSPIHRRSFLKTLVL